MSSVTRRKCAVNASAPYHGVDAGAGDPRHDLVQPDEHLLQPVLFLGEPELQVVELLDDAGVVRVGEHVGGLRHQRDRARDAVRLVLRLFEDALDLAADDLRDRAVQRGARREPALGR